MSAWPATFCTNPGFNRMFTPEALTLGLFFPLDAYSGDRPDISRQDELASRADRGGFAALWTRDVPLQDPDFGDLGQIIDPFVWCGHMLNHVQRATLAMGSIILPLRHPVHVAKAAASIEYLSNGRFVMGVAAGDRALEFPVFGEQHADRADAVRDHLETIRRLLTEEYPIIDSRAGRFEKLNLQPKPSYGQIPMGATGNCAQNADWLASHSDFWLTHNRPLQAMAKVMGQWRYLNDAAGFTLAKPVAQSMYLDLTEDPDGAPVAIHLGYRLGRNVLVELLGALKSIGVNHVAFMLRYSRRPADEVIAELAEYVLPSFPAHDDSK